MLRRAYYTHTCSLPPTVHCWAAESENEVSHYFIRPTNCTAEPFYIRCEALQNQGRIQSQKAFVREGQGMCFTTLPATAQWPPFPRLLWEWLQKKTLDPGDRSIQANMVTWVCALWSHPVICSGFFQTISSNYWWSAWDILICIK